jgi:electron transport complex protein RnfB
MRSSTAKPKRLPKQLAVIYADHCTGCEACIEVCPVDCIHLIHRDQFTKAGESWCEIDLERCIGCALCVRFPRRRSEPHEVTVCPWEAIEMVPTERVAQAVAQIGGRPEYIREHWGRLVGVAQHLAELRAQQTKSARG